LCACVHLQFLEGQLQRMHVAVAELERVADGVQSLRDASALTRHPLERLQEPVPPASVLEAEFPVLAATTKPLSPRRTPREVRASTPPAVSSHPVLPTSRHCNSPVRPTPGASNRETTV
jgi:hypothetical protein